MARPLDALFFDIDDTLFSTSAFAEQARRAAIDAMIRAGLRADPETCKRELDEVITEFSSNYGEHFDKVLQRLPGSATQGLNRAILIAAGIVAYHETKWNELEVYDDVYEVLSWLSTTRLIRGIISLGTTIKQAEKILRLGIYEFLTPSAIYFTDQIGINKPNPKLYQRVVRDQGLLPERVMYVGDNPMNDIDPCNAVGMITVRNRRSGRYAQSEGRTKPDFEIHDFHELRELLESQFEV